jgi:hypothetical protein
MKWFKKTQQAVKQITRKIAVNKVYTDKYGNDWFEYANPMNIPAKRAISAEVATRFADMNLTKANLQILMNEMKKKANEGNIVDLFSLLGEIEYRLNFIGEEETLMELACAYYLIADEDETDMTDFYREKKMEIFRKDKDAKNFFMEGAFRRTIKYLDMSEVDILDYLNQNAPNAKVMEQILHGLKSGDILMT